MSPPRKPPRAAARPRKGRPPRGPEPAAAGAEPERYGAADEPFWKHQERRMAGQLGQPCCTLSGMCTLLGGMTGNFAVVIHGERDCGNSFVHHRMTSAEQFFCTCLTEDQVTAGRVDEPLEQCLDRVLQERQPDAILVLGTCPVTMIGADPGPVVERVAARTATPIVLLRTGGLTLSTQAEMVDWLYETLAGLPQLAPGDAGWRQRTATALQEAQRALRAGTLTPDSVRSWVQELLTTPSRDRTVNLIGLPADGVHGSELQATLDAAGIEINGLYPFAADLDTWRSIAHASVNVVADRQLYPRLLASLEREYQLPSIEVPLPIGLGQSRRFYQAIGAFFGVEAALEEALAPRLAAAQARVDAFRARAAGTRVAMGLRMLNNYQVDQLAYEGLGDVEALTELGFDLTLLVQGPPEERPRFAERLAALGADLPLHVFPSPWNLAPLLAEGDFQVAYLADHGWEEARKAGVPMIKSRALAPLLAGVEQNLPALTELLRAAGRPLPEEA